MPWLRARTLRPRAVRITELVAQGAQGLDDRLAASENLFEDLFRVVVGCELQDFGELAIEGGQIVCNVCGTRWDLETLKGVSGGCQGYPPDVLKSTTDGGKISVDEATVLAWKARI